jgi:hypothetical protein
MKIKSMFNTNLKSSSYGKQDIFIFYSSLVGVISFTCNTRYGSQHLMDELNYDN